MKNYARKDPKWEKLKVHDFYDCIYVSDVAIFTECIDDLIVN